MDFIIPLVQNLFISNHRKIWCHHCHLADAGVHFMLFGSAALLFIAPFILHFHI